MGMTEHRFDALTHVDTAVAHEAVQSRILWSAQDDDGAIPHSCTKCSGYSLIAGHVNAKLQKLGHLSS